MVHSRKQTYRVWYNERREKYMDSYVDVKADSPKEAKEKVKQMDLIKLPYYWIKNKKDLIIKDVEKVKK